MTTITAELQVGRIEELIQRRRVARLIVVGSASFTALIAASAGISGFARFPAQQGTALAVAA